MLSSSRDSLSNSQLRRENKSLASSAESLRVTVRCRPLSAKEIARLPLEPLPTTFPTPFLPGISTSSTNGASQHLGNGQPPIRHIVSVLNEKVLVFDPPEKNATQSTYHVPGTKRFKNIPYTFDRVFDENATQQEVYENTTKPLIEGVLNGFNATVFAYGATGCGKTHTITGTQNDPGVIFRTMRDLFQCIRDSRNDRITEASVSYLEVYNETIRDLLAPDSAPPTGLELREDDVSVQVSGLSHHSPRDVDHIMRLLINGNNNRTRAPTEANEASSRSHAVLQIHVRTKDRMAGTHASWNTAVLSIIDLAGSERASVTKNRGDRLQEGAKINRSLLALGNCINALCNPATSSHVPYRDSKLTRLLKYSLGGNCRVVMIAAVSPASIHYEETHNTLQYANRAKNIRTKIQKNTVDVDSHIGEYGKIIEDLRNQVTELKSQLGASSPATEIIPDDAWNSPDHIGSAPAAEAIKRTRTLYKKLRAHRSSVHRYDVRKLLLEDRLSTLQTLLEVACGDEGDVPELVTVRQLTEQAVHAIEERLKFIIARMETHRRAALRVQGALERLSNLLPSEGPKALEVHLIRAEHERDDNQNRYEVLEKLYGEFADGRATRDFVTALLRIVGIVSRARMREDDTRLTETWEEAIRVLEEFIQHGGGPAGDDALANGTEDEDGEFTEFELEDGPDEVPQNDDPIGEREDDADFQKATDMELHKLDFGKYLSAQRLPPPVPTLSNGAAPVTPPSLSPPPPSIPFANAIALGSAKKRRRESGDDAPVAAAPHHYESPDITLQKAPFGVDAMEVESTPKSRNVHPDNYIVFPPDDLDAAPAVTPRVRPRNDRLRSDLVARLDSPRRRADRVAAASAGAIGLVLSPRLSERADQQQASTAVVETTTVPSPPGPTKKAKRRSMIPVSVSRRPLPSVSEVGSVAEVSSARMEVDAVPAKTTMEPPVPAPRKRIGRASVAQPPRISPPESTRMTRSKAARKSVAVK